jgi:hypothetical protein
MPAVICIILSISPTTSAVDQSVSPSASIGGHEAKFTDVNGARTRYYDAGSGEAILLIHGARPSGTCPAQIPGFRFLLGSASGFAFSRPIGWATA